MVRIAYVQPTLRSHEESYRLVREDGVLEKFQDLLGFVHLPEPLLIRFDGCDGVANAWYEPDDRTVTVCYGYIDALRRNAPKQTTGVGVTPEDAVVGPTVEVLLHEVAHAVFHLLSVPIIGREEEAADQLAAFAMTRFSSDEARRLILGTAHMYSREAQGGAPGLKEFSDAHGLPAQRLYNLLCIAYGSDPQQFGDLVEQGFLPATRAEGCAEEYRQVEQAVKKLIVPHVDVGKVERIRQKRWLR